MRILREESGWGSRPFPLDHERRRRVLVALAEREMTISNLSMQTKIPRAIVSQIINGRRRSPRTEQRIADFLGKPAEYLFPARDMDAIVKMRRAEAAAKGKTA